MYSKLQSCIAAIATGNYSAFDHDTNNTTTTPAPSVTPTFSPTDGEIDGNEEDENEEDENEQDATTNDDQVDDDADEDAERMMML